MEQSETTSEELPALVADVGGTNIRLATLTAGGLQNRTTHLCSRYKTLGEALEAYIDSTFGGHGPSQAAIDVAGPVTGDQVDLTNQKWSFSIEQLRSQLGLDKLIVVNDFTAQAAAIPRLEPQDVRLVKEGTALKNVSIAVLGPGTGLGVSGLVYANRSWIPLSGEGGHTTLGATNEREWAILEVLQGTFGRVSSERVLSGPGLVNLWRALSQLNGVKAEELTPAEVVKLAGEDPNSLAGEAVHLFSGWLGAVAGDHALTLGAWSGVYLCGGILPKMGNRFDRDHFIRRFVDKGRYRGQMDKIPVYLVLNAETAHLGLAALLERS